MMHQSIANTTAEPATAPRHAVLTSACSISLLAMTVLLLLLAVADGQSATAQPASQVKTMAKGNQPRTARVRVIYNIDCMSFFTRAFGPVVPATLDKFVDQQAADGITDLFINVNALRTDYRSHVWEAFWDGYDPKAGHNQPFFAGIAPKRRWGPEATEGQSYVDMYNFYKRGWDYPKLMIDRARKDHVSPWISIRMNDSESNQRNSPYPFYGTFYTSHPQWHLCNGPNPALHGGYAVYGLDYEQPEVREHYMKLIKEVCERYDPDGIELDYLRLYLYFRPGREHEGGKLMTAFIKEVREVTRNAARRWGHPIKLAVRVPSTPWIAKMHGLNAITWAKDGLVDLIVAGAAWDTVSSDVPLETWKGLLAGTDVQVVLGLDVGINSGSGRRVMSPAEYRGLDLSGLWRGSDGIYLFNMFGFPYQVWRPHPAEYDRVLRELGSYKALCELPRSIPITETVPWSEGEPGSPAVLPYTGTHGVFRLNIGPKPLPHQRTRIKLETAGHKEPLDVRMNGIACMPEHGSGDVYDAPWDAVSCGYNLVEVNAHQPVKITWVEITISK